MKLISMKSIVYVSANMRMKNDKLTSQYSKYKLAIYIARVIILMKRDFKEGRRNRAAMR
jgi:hypothetical protein